MTQPGESQAERGPVAATAETYQRLGPAGHNAPCSNKDFDFFYRGLEEGKLLVQQCARCGVLRNPPSPACPSCHSLKWQAIESSGRGRIHSYTVHYHPSLPGFAMPHPVALVAMEEGIRFVGAMDGTPADRLAIDLPVAVEFVRRGNLAAFRFRLAPEGGSRNV
jgi:hypothetical protein